MDTSDMPNQLVPLAHFRHTFFPETVFGDSLDLRNHEETSPDFHFAVPRIPKNRRVLPSPPRNCDPRLPLCRLVSYIETMTYDYNSIAELQTLLLAILSRQRFLSVNNLV